MRTNQINNLPYLKDTRRALRKQLTSAEAVLWTLLKSKQLGGRKFRRQHSIKNFIVDFYCPQEKLVVELDGSIHTNLGQANADNERDEVLKNLGVRVLRVENKLVFDQPDLVLEIISSYFSGYTTPSPS
ncbi:MAG: endonuclease domain-containing protein [Pyrinomonadaceae bacterium]|nr:endonuclease domain-containing protein [Sphingobacteriaceae bacterium]